jgi:hypothetical protein
MTEETASFLIAHKVRGETAFDIAIRCDDMGTPSDPGPWWIIPTSGHRAYPYWQAPLSELYWLGQMEHEEHGGLGYPMASFPIPGTPTSVRDHYQYDRDDRTIASREPKRSSTASPKTLDDL